SELGCDFVIVNCENAAGGFGVTPAICDDLFACGIDVLTTGNHVFDKAEITSYMSGQPKLLRPANMAEGLPGQGSVIVRNEAGLRLGVANIMANLFMAENANAFAAADQIKSAVKLGRDVDGLVIDFHGEATSEKMAMGHYFDGAASLVVGTHTHIPTADCRILPGGTAYQTDAGMCGDYDSVIGMNKDAATGRFTGVAGGRLSVAGGEPSLSGLVVDIDPATGLAVKVAAFRRGGVLENPPSV
ncbi:MAG: TIGR00282 family metallophosphoesterase, partial [Pseudomonadota bacterium]|nr:TIGR00282 family metallophosphoesterase [Pseudomonadota bacterium]